MPDFLVDLVNSFQSGFTVTYIWVAVLLLIIYWPLLHASVGVRPWKPVTWHSVGIGVTYFFSSNDWSYWLVTWLAVLFDLPEADLLFEYGPVSNLVTRQIPSIYAGYCHIVAAKMQLEDQPADSRFMILPLLAGIGVSVALFFGAMFS